MNLKTPGVGKPCAALYYIYVSSAPAIIIEITCRYYDPNVTRRGYLGMTMCTAAATLAPHFPKPSDSYIGRNRQRNERQYQEQGQTEASTRSAQTKGDQMQHSEQLRFTRESVLHDSSALPRLNDSSALAVSVSPRPADFAPRISTCYDDQPAAQSNKDMFAATQGPAAAQEPAAPRAKVPLLRVFRVQLVELTSLTELAIVQQTFTAQFYIEFRINGGAHDAELCNPSSDFPFGSDGKPTFLPSAAWFINQLDFNNAKLWRKLDSHIRKEGDDLIIAVRVVGTFSEFMELHGFPFDSQDLTISLAIVSAVGFNMQMCCIVRAVTITELLDPH